MFNYLYVLYLRVEEWYLTNRMRIAIDEYYNYGYSIYVKKTKRLCIIVYDLADHTKIMTENTIVDENGNIRLDFLKNDLVWFTYEDGYISTFNYELGIDKYSINIKKYFIEEDYKRLKFMFVPQMNADTSLGYEFNYWVLVICLRK